MISATRFLPTQLVARICAAFCKAADREDLRLRLLFLALIGLLLVLNHLLWLREDRGVRQVYLLQQEIAERRAENMLLEARNARLEAEIQSLDAFDAIEEQARVEFGMIREGETFFQFLYDPIPPGHPTVDATVMEESHE